MFWVYILKSLKNGRYYVGSTGDLEDRLKRHNAGQSKSTKPFLPYNLVYFEEYQTLRQARKRESDIKKRKSKKFIDNLISQLK